MSKKNPLQTFFTTFYQDALDKIKNFYRSAYESDAKKTQAISQITLIGAIAAWLALPVYILGGLLSGESQYHSLADNDLFLAIGLSITHVLARLKLKYAPALLTVLLVEVTFVRVNLYIDGLGIILGIVLFAIVANIAIQGFPGRPAILVILTALIAAGACIAIDILNLPTDRIQSPFWLQQVVLIMGGLVVLLVSINLLNTLSFKSIRSQLSLGSLINIIVPIITILAVSFLTQMEDLRNIEKQEMKQVTSLLANEFNLQLTSLATKAESETKISAIQRYFSGRETRANVLETMNALSSQNPFILSYGLLDARGNSVIDTLAFNVGKNHAESEWFKNTISGQKGFISEVYYEENLVRQVFYVSAPVFVEQEIAGVLRVQYDGELLRNLLRSRINRMDPSFTAILVEANGIILVHTANPGFHSKSLFIFQESQISELQSAGKLPQGRDAESLFADLPEVASSLQSNPAGGDIFSASLNQEEQIPANFSTAAIPNHNWVLVAGQAETVSALDIFERNLPILLAVVIILLVATIAIISTSGLIIAPIQSLLGMAQEVGSGNLNITSGISREDEFGALAHSLDETTLYIRTILQNLEDRVSERTNQLAQANELATLRAEQLRVISSVALAVNQLKNLRILLPNITEEISKAFGYYHVGIFLIEPSGQYAVLQAANSEGGRRMLARGHRLRVGQVGIVGFVTGFGQERIALDVGEDATFFNNPDLPQTHSEMALPLKSGNKIIGALDLQSELPAAFSEQDIDALSLLADQISTAIQNARLFDETQSALTEAQLIFSRNVQSGWREILRSENSSFRFSNGQLFAGEEIEETETGESPNLLNLPIVIRGETLGTLKIKSQTQSEWSEQDLRVLQSIVDRIGFALENARLFRDAQRLVSKEQLIGDISDKISRSVNLDSILQIAVEELGHIIADSEVTIQVGEHESLQSHEE